MTRQEFDELVKIKDRPRVGFSDRLDKLTYYGMVEKFGVDISNGVWFLAYRITQKGLNRIQCDRCKTIVEFDRCPNCFERKDS